MFTRRDTTKMLLGSAAATAFPSVAGAGKREDWVAAIQKALASATRPGGGTRLTLTQFGFRKSGGRASMAAIVRMDWPPGIRTRRFDVRGASEQGAFEALVEQVTAEFRRANPDGIA